MSAAPEGPGGGSPATAPPRDRAEPVVELVDATKVYGHGDAAVHALRGVTLRIERGEAVAITGTSGSGKSTLMNLIGCLDRPTGGVCRVGGRDVGALDADGRAALRNQTIGFVFQGFHLLARTTAQENVELPLVYQGGVSAKVRRARARAQLERVGLGERLDHVPSELSGGQQQRVAIARALVTAPALILADEPTGNLDSKTTHEVLDLLEDLHRHGITIVCVTHEPDVAARFPRRIEVKDGQIAVDTGTPPDLAPPGTGAGATSPPRPDHLAAFPVALRAIRRHLLRSALTALGIVIGVAAVVGMLAIGRGARAALQQQVATLGTNLVTVRAGSGGRGGVRGGSGSGNPLTLDDFQAVQRACPSLAHVSPQVRASVQAIAGNANWATSVEGYTDGYLEIRNIAVASGGPIDPVQLRQGAKVCLLGPTVVRELFGGGDPVGATIRVSRVPMLVVGVLAPRGESSWGQDQDDVILAPLTVVQRRLSGKTTIDALYGSALTEDLVDQAVIEIQEALRAHRRLGRGAPDDFDVRTQAQMAQFAGGMLQTMSLLLAAIAGVSLVVGGIGIMNIMLVSVTERTREIGIRLAIGARGRDVLVQFLVEAVLISVGGGLLGVGLGVAIDRGVGLVAGWPSGIGADSVALAVGFSSLVGVFFGLYPARVAARLDPIVALRHE